MSANGRAYFNYILFFENVQNFSKGTRFDLECARWMNGERKELQVKAQFVYMKIQGVFRDGNY